MKRKISVLMLAALMLAALMVPAFADVMWEPYGNSFYESHRDACRYVDRSYLANGEHGYITIKVAPNSLVQVKNLANGNTFRVVQVWTDSDGSEWAVGYHMVRTDKGGWESYEGWVSMSELALIYDYIAFAEDHSTEFEAYDGSGDHLTEVCMYSYPNGRYAGTLTESKDYMAFAESFEHLYTDEEGKHWTFVGYYMGRNNAWICLDDPSNENLGTEGYLTVGQVRSGEDLIPLVQPGKDDLPDADVPEKNDEVLIPPAEEIPAAKTWVVWAIPAALVIVVAVVTALIVRKKNKKA